MELSETLIISGGAIGLIFILIYIRISGLEEKEELAEEPTLAQEPQDQYCAKPDDQSYRLSTDNYLESRLQKLIADPSEPLINIDFIAILDLSSALRLWEDKSLDIDSVRHHIQAVSGYMFYKTDKLEGRIKLEEIYVSKEGFERLGQGESIDELAALYNANAWSHSENLDKKAQEDIERAGRRNSNYDAVYDPNYDPYSDDPFENE